MPLIFNIAGQPASGSYTFDGNDTGPGRLIVAARGGQLTSCGVALDGAPLDASVFNSLAEDATAQLWLDRPIGQITLTPVGIAFDARLHVALRP